MNRKSIHPVAYIAKIAVLAVLAIFAVVVLAPNQHPATTAIPQSIALGETKGDVSDKAVVSTRKDTSPSLDGSKHPSTSLTTERTGKFHSTLTGKAAIDRLNTAGE